MVYVALAKLKKNSVSTTLSGGITDSDSTIPVAELAVFYDADSVLITKGIVLGYNDVTESASEEITITGASGTSGAGNLTGATRGVKADGSDGIASAWGSGTRIAVMFSTGIYDQICNNIAAHESGKAPNPFFDYIRLPASAWTVYTPLSMGGTGAELVTEKLSNGIERTYLGYGYATTQYAYLEIDLPEDCADASNLTIAMQWETVSAAGDTCVMDLYGARFADGSASNVALSTKLATMTDTNTGANQRNKSAETAPFTITGAGKHLSLVLVRDFATDTLDAQAKILGTVLKIIRTLV